MTKLQADEAQRRNYNDGYSPYGANPTPYDPPFTQPQPYGSPMPDPFANPAPSQAAGLQDPYSIPPRQSPAVDYMTPHYNPDFSAHPNPASQPPSQAVRYDLHDEPGEPDDLGDIPLLRRDGSRASGYSIVSMPHVPGAYEDDNMSENNIRYGRIPQRVPRRYKTIKKVE